jgi:hypothetical protein
MKLQTAKGSDLAGGGMQYVDRPGTYHFLIDNVKVGLNAKDEPIDGTLLELTCLAGEDAEQVGKTVNVTLWDVDASKSHDEQKQTINRLTNFFISVNQIDPALLGDEVDVDPMAAIGHQIVMKLAHKQKKTTDQNGKTKWVDDPESKFLQIAYADVHHVDDPAVAKVPKDVSMLKRIASKHRHAADWFAYKDKSAVGAGRPTNYDDL